MGRPKARVGLFLCGRGVGQMEYSTMGAEPLRGLTPHMDIVRFRSR
jgi:hypothetical protein